MKILLSNDDGYQSLGINVLAKVLSEIAEITIIAPDRDRTGASNSLTLETPLRVHKVRENVYYVNGTPTDCVHLGVTGLLDELPDMVVSGINKGVNLGDDVIYSGTVAAAMEGRFLGMSALAVSLDKEAKSYEAAAQVTKDLILRLSKNSLPPKTILNVNVPNKPWEELKGYEITRLGTRHCAQPSVKQTDPRGNEVYWVGLSGKEQDAGPGTDFHALRAGKVSITPLQIEWTNYEAFEQVADWMQDLNLSLKGKK